MSLTNTAFLPTPYSYARHLASYIMDPSTIRARTRDEYGRSPPIDIIREMIAEANKPIPQRRDIAEDRPFRDDGLPWRPRGLVQDAPKSRLRLVHASGAGPAVDPNDEPETEIDAPRPACTPLEVIAEIGSYYGVTATDLKSKSRALLLVRARNTAAYALRQRGNSFPKIGRWLGGRDHSTIVHACEKFEERATADEWALVRRFYGEPVE